MFVINYANLVRTSEVGEYLAGGKKVQEIPTQLKGWNSSSIPGESTHEAFMKVGKKENAMCRLEKWVKRKYSEHEEVLKCIVSYISVLFKNALPLFTLSLVVLFLVSEPLCLSLKLLVVLRGRYLPLMCCFWTYSNNKLLMRLCHWWDVFKCWLFDDTMDPSRTLLGHGRAD